MSGPPKVLEFIVFLKGVASRVFWGFSSSRCFQCEKRPPLPSQPPFQHSGPHHREHFLDTTLTQDYLRIISFPSIARTKVTRSNGWRILGQGIQWKSQCRKRTPAKGLAKKWQKRQQKWPKMRKGDRTPFADLLWPTFLLRRPEKFS